MIKEGMKRAVMWSAPSQATLLPLLEKSEETHPKTGHQMELDHFSSLLRYGMEEEICGRSDLAPT